MIRPSQVTLIRGTKTLLVAALVVGGLGIGAAASVPGMQVGGWLALTLFALLAAPLLHYLP